MKYVLLGSLNPQWVGRQRQRTNAARAKLKQLGIKLESVYYTQGPFDFVDVVDAPDAASMLAFSVWYACRGFGKMVTSPAFDDRSFARAVSKS